MNSKTVLLIKKLMNGHPRKLKDLAEQLDISMRLVRYEMNEANAFLEKANFPILQYERSDGIRLILNEQQKAELVQKMASLDVYDYVLTSAERRCIMSLMMLANGNEPLTCQHFADRLGVSKSSIDKDMSLLKTDLLGSGIHLESKVAKGNTLVGDEQELRHYAVRLLEQHIDFAGLYLGGADSTNMVERLASDLFCDENLPEIFQLVRKMEERTLGKWLAYDSFRMLTLTLAVMLVRIRSAMTVETEPANIGLVKTTKEYVYAVQLAQMLQERFSVELPPGEIYALAILFASARYVIPEPYLKEDWVSVQMLIDRLVRGMSEEMEIDFVEDEEIYNALQMHLGPTVFRLKHGIPITNPNLSEIKKTYVECFAALEQVLKKLDSRLLDGITEDDIAYLVLHFCASIERRKRMKPVSRVAIVCVHGAGTANLLRELVCSKFKHIRVVATVTYTDMQLIENLDVDFVIASVPLPGCNVPWVQVDTIPTAENWEAIGRMSLKYGAIGQACQDGIRLFKDVMQTVQRHCDINDMDEFESDLAVCFETNGISLQVDRVQPALAQLLKPEKVLCHQTAADWEIAVSLACKVLEETGEVTPEFTRSAIQSVQNAGPYIVIMPGVALVHGEVGKGIKRLAMSLVTFEDGVCFHHPSHDPVYLVFCLAPTDSWSHIQALRDLLDLLNRVPVQVLCEVKSPQELCNYLKGS